MGLSQKAIGFLRISPRQFGDSPLMLRHFFACNMKQAGIYRAYALAGECSWSNASLQLLALNRSKEVMPREIQIHLAGDWLLASE